MISQPIGWSTIFAATVVAGSVWLVLHLFGIGVGLTAIEPGDPSSLRGVGIGTGIWSVIAPILALFVGGLVAGRVAPTINTVNAAIHGAVVWGLTMLLSLVVTVMMLGALMRGATTVASTAGDLVGQAPMGQLRELPGALGLDRDDAVASLNRQLQQQGMPGVTAEQLESVAQQVVDRAVRTGGIERQEVVDIVARETSLSQADAEKLGSQIDEQVGSLTQRARTMASQASRTALQAAETTGKVVLWLSLGMVLTLGAAVFGSILAVRRERREHVVLPRATTTR